MSCDHDPGVASTGTELPLTGGGLELALTGGNVSPWVLGGGAAALVAGGVLVATGVTRRIMTVEQSYRAIGWTTVIPPPPITVVW